MFNPRVAVEGYVRPSLGFHCSKSSLYTENLSSID